MFRPHKQLDVWPLCMLLIKAVYVCTTSFPASEEFGLKAQMRRAAVSLASNIAEGLSRSGMRDRIRFLQIARASLSELDAQVEITGMMGMTTLAEGERLVEQMTRIDQMLQGLIRSLRARTDR